ncbi:MAG: hypothetical protein PHY29_04675, partial [Syntrophales bacterium]|nr:hypothetical protein [Syntrophales bacterium]
KAREGVFSQWSLRACPPWAMEHYFRKTGPNEFAIIPEIREMVAFSYLNLVEDAYASPAGFTNAIDVILCRNALMYFSEEVAIAAVDKLSNCLVPGGWLVLSPVEAAFVKSTNLSPHRYPEAILYRKGGKSRKEGGIRSDADIPSTVIVYNAVDAPAESASKRRRTSVAKKRQPVLVPTQENDISSTRCSSPVEKAREYLARGLYSDAIRELQGIDAHHPDYLKALSLLAKSHANQGSLEEAIRYCDLALSSNKLVAGIHFLRSNVLQEQGAQEEAKEFLKKALYLDPDFVMAHFAMFVLSGSQGNVREAERQRKILEKLLSCCGQEEILPDSDGITAGRLENTLRSLTVP